MKSMLQNFNANITPRPVRILQSLMVMIALCFFIAMMWWITGPITAALIDVFFGVNTATAANPIFYILKTWMNYWGVVGIVIVIVAWGYAQAERREWRDEGYG